MRRLLRLAGLLLLLTLLSACGGSSSSELRAARSLDGPTVYRVNATAESRFSGPISDRRAATKLTAAFEATPVSDSEVRVEVVHLAAGVRNAEGEFVGLSLGDLAGTQATVELAPPGHVARISGSEELLEAPTPLISVENVIHGLFPPLPGETVSERDTWTGDTPFPFPNLGGPPVRTRYVMESIDSSAETGRVDGYELSVSPSSFQADTPSGRISGEGEVQMELQGELEAGEGYLWRERTTTFESSSIQLADSGSYDESALRLEQTFMIERLGPAEQLGFDL